MLPSAQSTTLMSTAADNMPAKIEHYDMEMPPMLRNSSSTQYKSRQKHHLPILCSIGGRYFGSKDNLERYKRYRYGESRPFVG